MSGAPEGQPQVTAETTQPPAITTPTPTTPETTPATLPGEKSLLNQEAAPVPKGAPEKYEAFKTPEGFDLDTGVAEAASAKFKAMGLNQTQAQELVDFYSEHAIKSNQEMIDLVNKQRETWQNEAKNHPDLKGKLDAGGPVLTTISRALDSLGDVQLKADFREAMDMTGAGNHPAFIRAFYKLASRLVEGTTVAGNGPSPHGQLRPGQRPPTPAQALYPNLPTNSGGG